MSFSRGEIWICISRWYIQQRYLREITFYKNQNNSHKFSMFQILLYFGLYKDQIHNLYEECFVNAIFCEDLLSDKIKCFKNDLFPLILKWSILKKTGNLIA